MATQVTHNNDGHFYTIDVDLAKEGAEVFDLTTYFKARVADNNVGLRFRWFWQGQVFNTVGKKPRVVGLVGQYSFKKADDGTNRELVMSPDASAVAFTGDVNDCEPGGYATYYFPEQMFPQDGMFKGTVGLLDDSGETARYTSVDIWFKVYPQAGGAQMGKACDFYIGELDKAIKEAEEDLKAGQKAQQQVIDEYQQKVTDLVNQLNTQGQTANSMMETVKAGLTTLEAKIQQDGLFTQAEAEAFENRIQNALSSYGLNVKSYGAKGDGVTDDTAAIQAALDDASKKDHIVFVPAGKYLVTKPLNIDHLTLYGENSTDTVLIGTAAIGELLLVGSNCYVHGLCLSVNGTATTTNVSLIRIGSQSGSMFNSFNDIAIRGSKDINCIGIYANPYGTQDTIGSNCSFANRFTNVSMDNVDVGIKLDANNFSWINGNSFTHVLIRNVKTSGIWLTSSVGNNQQGIYKNVFDDIQIQYLDASGSQSRAILLQCGRNNRFTNITHWNDASTALPSIELSGSAGAQEIEIRDNMVSGAVEGEIIATPKLRGLNKFKIVSETSNKHSFGNSSASYDSKIEYPTNNLIGSDMIDQFVSQPQFVPLTIGPSGSTAVVNTGYDDAGAYLSVKNTGASATHIFLTLPPKIAKKLALSPASTTSVLFDVDVADITTINLGSYVALYDNNGKTYSCDITAKFTETDRQEYAMTCIQDGGKWGIKSHDVGGAYLIISLSGAAEFKIRGVRLTDQYASHYRSINNVRGCSTFWLETVANKDINNFGDMGFYIPLDTIVAPSFTKSWIRKLDNGTTQLVNYPFVI